jgi:phage terminase Nu1 subunit (DNA packaging protein)
MAATDLPDCVGTETLATLLGVTGRHIRDLAARGVIKKIGRDRYRLAEAIRAVFAHVRSSVETKSEATTGFRKARTELIELELAEKRRAVIALAEAEAVVDFLAGKFGTALDALPARVTRNPALRRGLQAEVVALQNDLAESFARAADALGGKQDALFGKTTD